jgi:hypothetical protein
MGGNTMDINNWGTLFTDEQVTNIIQNYKDDLLQFNGDISANVINEVYNTIINNSHLTNRAKLFYLQDFENMLIESRIRTDKNAIDYMNSLALK